MRITTNKEEQRDGFSGAGIDAESPYGFEFKASCGAIDVHGVNCSRRGGCDA